MDIEKRIPLQYPIPRRKEAGAGVTMVHELVIGRFKAKHLKLLPKEFVEQEGKIHPTEILPLLAGLTELPLESIDELDMADLMNVAEELESFFDHSLEGFQETGKNCSGE